MLDRSAFTRISQEAETDGYPTAYVPLHAALVDGLAAFALRIEHGQHGPDAAKAQATETQKALDAKKNPLCLEFAALGYDIAGECLGRKGFEGAGQKAMKAIKAFVVGMDQEAPLTSNFLGVKIHNWLLETSKIETTTSAAQYEAIWKEMMVQGLTDSRSLGEAIIDFGLARTIERADLMARTVTIYSYNAGAADNYREAGVTEKEWLVTEDDALCPICASYDGRVVHINGMFARKGDTIGSGTAAFDIPNPPLHPRCRCVLLPVV